MKGKKNKKKLDDSRAVDGVDVLLLPDRAPHDLVQRERTHEPGAVEEDELMAGRQRRGERGVGLLGRRGHATPPGRRFLRRDPVAVAIAVCRRCSGLLLLRRFRVQKGHVPAPGVGVGRDVRRHRHDPGKDRRERVVDRREDLRGTQHAAGPALRDKDTPRRQLLLDDVFVKLVRVELEAGPSGDRVREVADDDVKGRVGRGAKLRRGVVADELEPRVGERGLVRRQVLLAEVADDAVDVDHQALFDGSMLENFARRRALAAAGDEDAPRAAVGDEGRVDEHLVVDVLVGLGGLGLAVEEEDLLG